MSRQYVSLMLVGVVIVLCAANTLAIDPHVVWTKTYGGPGNDRGYSVQQTSDGGYIIAAKRDFSGGGGSHIYLLKTNAHGDTVWAKTYGDTGYSEGLSVQQTADGGYIIVGSTHSLDVGRCDVYLVKTDPNGDTLWTRTYGGDGWDYGYSVQQTSDGRYIVAGCTGSVSEGYLVWLIKMKP